MYGTNGRAAGVNHGACRDSLSCHAPRLLGHRR
jgi:hypothetical protein